MEVVASSVVAAAKGAAAAPISTGMTVAGLGMTAMGQMRAGRDEEAAFKQRAAMLEAQSAEELRAGRERGRLTRSEGRRLTARQKVLAAKGGVKSFTGAPLLVQVETLAEIEHEAAILQAEGGISSQQLLSQAEYEKRTGRRRRKAGVFAAGTSLLTGGGLLYGSLRKRGMA